MQQLFPIMAARHGKSRTHKVRLLMSLVAHIDWQHQTSPYRLVFFFSHHKWHQIGFDLARFLRSSSDVSLNGTGILEWRTGCAVDIDSRFDWENFTKNVSSGCRGSWKWHRKQQQPEKAMINTMPFISERAKRANIYQDISSLGGGWWVVRPKSHGACQTFSGSNSRPLADKRPACSSLSVLILESPRRAVEMCEIRVIAVWALLWPSITFLPR